MTVLNNVKLVTDELRAVSRMAGSVAAARFAAAIARSLPEVLRTRTLAAADNAMHGTWSLRAGEHRVTLDGRYWSGAREMYGRAVYLPNSEFVIRPGEQVVDLGANAGLFSLYAAAHGARVLAVEAQHLFADEVLVNLTRNGLAERVAIEVALIGAGTGTFAHAEDVLRGDHATRIPPTVALETLLDRHGFTHIDFLKVDIEGSEFALFAASDAWLPRVRRLVMEVHPAHGSVPELVARLQRAGFTTRVTDDRQNSVDVPSERGGYVYARR